MALIVYTEKNCKNCKCDCFNAGLDDYEICTEYKPCRAVYLGRKENDMSEREIERILAEEADEAKVLEAIEEYLKGEE